MTDKKITTLSEDDIQTERQVGRRGALGIMGASILGAAAAAAGIALPGAVARAQTDSDSGENSDTAGHGQTGATDRDSGGGSDRAGHGVCPGRGTSDSDSGNGADPAGGGRGPCR